MGIFGFRSTWESSHRNPSRSLLVSPFDPLTPSTSQEYFPASLDSSIISPFRRVIRALKDCSATLLPISLQNTSYSPSTYYVIASTEASSKLAPYSGVQYGLHVPLPPDVTVKLDRRVKCTHIRARPASAPRRRDASCLACTLSSSSYDRMTSLVVHSTTTFASPAPMPVHFRRLYARLSRAQPARVLSGSE